MPPSKTTRLQSARRRASLTQVQLAARAGIALSTLSLAERFGVLSKRTAEKIAAVLQVAVEDLLEPEPRADEVRP